VPGASQAGALAHKTQLNHDKLSATITVAPHQRSIRRKIVIVRGSLNFMSGVSFRTPLVGPFLVL